MKRILINGSTAYDLLLSCELSFADAFTDVDLQNLSTVFLALHFQRHHGGTAANIAWTCALLGGNPLMVSTVGQDGGPYCALLEERNIDTQFIDRVEDHATSTAIIGTDNGERQLGFFHPGADQEGSWPDLDAQRDDIAYAIASPRDERLMLRCIEWCNISEIPCFFDPGQRIHNFSEDELLRASKEAHGIIANDYEWDVLSTKLSTDEKGMLDLCEVVIITHGEKGVSVHSQEESFDIPASKAEKVVNPTGAGDAFRAGLLTKLTEGVSLRDAVKFGNAVASLVVEIEGTLLEDLDLDEIENRIQCIAHSV